MATNRQVESARRWCSNMTMAHFHVTLDDATQKAVIAWYDGSIWRDVPDNYQAGTVALLRDGEEFTACSLPPTVLHRQAQYQHLLQQHNDTEIQPLQKNNVRKFLDAIASVDGG